MSRYAADVAALARKDVLLELRSRDTLPAMLLFVVSALVVSCALVVFTAWRHQFSHGLFALLFAVLSAQIALNWFLWKDDEE